jgi:hypothetical protein
MRLVAARSAERKPLRTPRDAITRRLLRCYQMTKPSEPEQRELASQFFTDVLIAELQKRDYVVLAKQQHANLVDDAEAILERTDIPR